MNLERITMSNTAAVVTQSVKPSIEVTVTSEELQNLVIYSTRYTIGRMTYAPSIMDTFIRKYLNQLSTATLFVLVRDIESESERGLGEDCDRKMWLNLLNTLKIECDKRKIK